MIPKPDKPAWAGPYEGGITQSLMDYPSCPFSAYLYFVCGLKEARPLDPNLMWGDILHKGLEHALRGDPLDVAKDVMMDYMNKQYPNCPSTFGSTTWEMLKLYPVNETIDLWGGIHTEVKIDEHINLPRVYSLFSNNYYELTPERKVRVKGKIDMLSYAGDRIGDHKCKGRLYPHDTLQEINHDFQMNFYAKIKGGIEHWQYDLIHIPEEMYRVPERRSGESSDHWANRIFNVYSDTMNGFPIARFKHRWMFNIPYFQPKADNEEYYNFTIVPLIHRMCNWWDYVTHPNFDPNDPRCYNAMFYQAPVRLFNPAKTDKFKCKYHSVLTKQIGYEQLVPVGDFYPELAEDE